jgi:hypothetical protein
MAFPAYIIIMPAISEFHTDPFSITRERIDCEFAVYTDPGKEDSYSLSSFTDAIVRSIINYPQVFQAGLLPAM